MDKLLKARAELLAAAQGIATAAKSAQRDMTADEMTAVKGKLDDIANLDGQIADARKSANLLSDLAGVGTLAQDETGEALASDGTVGDSFVKSAGYQSFMKANPAGVGSGAPIHIEAKGIGGFGDLGIGTKATITTLTGQTAPSRLPGYRSTLIDQKITFLDLITTGTTDSPWIEYLQILSETDNSAIVAEGELKPLSDLTTGKADAKAHTYADGFDVTNQTLADQGALAAFMESRLRWHLRNRIEHILLNGNGVADPKGILNTTGTQAVAFNTDVLTTVSKGLAYLEGIQVEPQAIVMNPADVWALRMLKATDGHWLNGDPFNQSVTPTPFGVPLVPSSRIAVGKALVGNFSGVQLLMREPLSVTAFNQHKDYAQRNMTYVRAELRALQFVYAPREIAVLTITGS